VKLWVTSFFFYDNLESVDAENWDHIQATTVGFASHVHIVKWKVAFWARALEDDIPYSVEMLVQNFYAIPRLFM